VLRQGTKAVLDEEVPALFRLDSPSDGYPIRVLTDADAITGLERSKMTGMRHQGLIAIRPSSVYSVAVRESLILRWHLVDHN